MPDKFLFYRSFAEIIEQIPEAEAQLKFYKALVNYGLEGIKTEFEYPFSLLFEQMCASISSAQQKHEKRVEAGRKGGQASKGGGAPKGNQNAKNKNNKQTTSKQQANNNINNNINKNNNIGIDIVDDNINTSAPTVCAPLKAAQPSVRVTWETVQDEDGKVRFIKHEHGGNTT